MVEVVVFGDIHIGSRHSRLGELRRCLKSASPEEVVMTGDLFENQHRRVGHDEAVRLIRKALELLQLEPLRVFIALSRASHDPQLPGPLVARVGRSEVVAHNGEVFVDGAVKIVASHGDGVIKSGVVAYLADIVRRGHVGRVLRSRLGVPRDVWVVYGHSHVPFIDAGERILNPGAWKVYGIRRVRGSVYRLPSAKPLC
ncbi:MAG: metallophosphoesterase [Thermoproteaceae archaeon]|nr:metallophosphoesterase [Thermoproteaceae archaeon]